MEISSGSGQHAGFLAPLFGNVQFQPTEYDKDMFEITQEIYKIGLERFEERQVEIDEFLENLEEGQRDIQTMGQNIIEEFLRFKVKLFDDATEVLKKLEVRTLNGEDEVSLKSKKII